MADERYIRIAIVNEKTDNNATSSTEAKTAKPKSGGASSKMSKVASAYIARSIVNNTISSVISATEYHFEKQWQLDDDYISQRTYTIAKNFITASMGAVSTIAVGFSTAGIAGGILATAYEAINTGMNIYKNYDQQSIKIKQMDAQLDYTRVRAGYSVQAESIGEGK